MGGLVMINGVDRCATSLGSPLAKLICLAFACEQGLLALPNRDRESLATVFVDQEIAVGETVDLFEIR